MDSEEAMINKLKVNPGLTSTRPLSIQAQPQTSRSLSRACVSFFAASLRLRVHEQAAQNVHGHERERRPQQQVQQLHQDAGHGGGPGHQLPNLRVAGEPRLRGLIQGGSSPRQVRDRSPRLVSRRQTKTTRERDFFLSLFPPARGDLVRVGSS